jgi:ribosomal protein S12 methylthiotransferase accessory factor YcaO
MMQTLTVMIDRLAQALTPDFRIMPLDLPDAPVFVSVAMPQSEAVTGLKPRLPAGRGMSVQQAMVAAGAEALELRASLAQYHAAALRDLPKVDGFAMISATDLMSGAVTPVLAQEVYLDCAEVLAEPLVWDANSTGCAAGPTPEEATQTALWEAIERDSLALWWHGNVAAPALGLEVIDALQPRLFWELYRRSRSTMLLDITSDIGLPAVAAVSSAPDGPSGPRPHSLP